MEFAAGLRGAARPTAIFLASLLISVCFLLGTSSQRASAQSPSADVAAGDSITLQALASARAGNVSLARQQYATYKTKWTGIEDGVRAASRDDYRTIEARVRDVDAVLVADPPDQARLVDALTALDQAQKGFIANQGGAQTAIASAPPVTGAGPAVSSPVPVVAAPAAGDATVGTLLQELTLARAATDRGDYAGAAAQVKAFESTWPDVEGQVKTRSTSAYSQTENDMGLAAGLLEQSSPEAKSVLQRMYVRLAPFGSQTQYGVYDAAAILLREGLEALLVLVALLAVLTRSGAADRRSWVWGGAAAGLVLSIALGVALHQLLSSLMNPGNRELIEGVTGLVAAGMLLYVSYWLHNNTSIQGWQRQIRNRTHDALTTGSLFGLAALAFLAIFREGAETVLFFLGMAAQITTRDLLTGLAIGSAGLVVLGALIMIIGVRIPMRPFFAVAGVLVFYLCFKFLGTGLHALQVAGILPTSSSPLLPASDIFGLSPTWQTTIPQLLLLALAASVVLEGWVKQRRLDTRSGAAAAAD